MKTFLALLAGLALTGSLGAYAYTPSYEFQGEHLAAAHMLISPLARTEQRKRMMNNRVHTFYVDQRHEKNRIQFEKYEKAHGVVHYNAQMEHALAQKRLDEKELAGWKLRAKTDKTAAERADDRKRIIRLTNELREDNNIADRFADKLHVVRAGYHH